MASLQDVGAARIRYPRDVLLAFTRHNPQASAPRCSTPLHARALLAQCDLSRLPAAAQSSARGAPMPSRPTTAPERERKSPKPTRAARARARAQALGREALRREHHRGGRGPHPARHARRRLHPGEVHGQRRGHGRAAGRRRPADVQGRPREAQRRRRGARARGGRRRGRGRGGGLEGRDALPQGGELPAHLSLFEEGSTPPGCSCSLFGGSGGIPRTGTT